LLVERAKEEGDETIAIVPLEGDTDGRMATMIQMKGRLMGLYAALGAILLVAVALAALFWKPGGMIDSTGGKTGTPEVITGLVFIALVMVLVFGWLKGAFFPPTPMYGDGGTDNAVFDALANDDTDVVEAGALLGTASSSSPAEEDHWPLAAPAEVELQLAPRGQGNGADEAV